jgi:tRNA pseudouridine synthase 10
VSHRRADLVRKRQVHSIELLEYHQDHAIIRVDCEGGLYVKELISSDEGRTTPSLTGMLGLDAMVEELDVVDVKI